MTGFIPYKSARGEEDPSLIPYIIKNSAVVQIGDMVTLDQSGVVRRTVGGEPILGCVQGVTDVNGGRIDPDAGTLDTYTVASDNATVGKKKALVVIAAQDQLFLNKSAGTVAQTNVGQYADLTDESQVSNTFTDSATANVRVVELDPENTGDATIIGVQVVESQWAQTNLNVPA